MRQIAIYGTGSLSREVSWLIDDINEKNFQWEFIGFFDERVESEKIDPDLYMGNIETLNNWKTSLGIVFALDNSIVKKEMVNMVCNGNIYFPALVHPSVIKSKSSVVIGDGSIIAAGCILTVDANVGNHVLLSHGCTVGHDSVIGNYSSCMPAVNISGEVTIGQAVFIGIGAKIINQLEIGDETVIGAGAVVYKSLPARCTAEGIPAKPIAYH